tara:strand:- start:17 stop:568 length:552 start_codon:yes stop_codon:yes gene_type:complete
MPDKKISELNGVSLPLTGTEEIPIVQNGETKKVTSLELGGNSKRIININLPFIRITQSSTVFYWQRSFGLYTDFILSTGVTDKNNLVGNTSKALLQVPFNCKIKSISFNSSSTTNSEIVIGKLSINGSNYSNCYDNLWSGSGFFDENPTMLVDFTKGDFLIPYFKINTSGVAYSQFNITLEEI